MAYFRNQSQSSHLNERQSCRQFVLVWIPHLQQSANVRSSYGKDGENQYHAILDGDICAMAYLSDMAPALIALDAKAEIAGPKGIRTTPLEQFLIWKAYGGEWDIDFPDLRRCFFNTPEIMPSGFRFHSSDRHGFGQLGCISRFGKLGQMVSFKCGICLTITLVWRPVVRTRAKGNLPSQRPLCIGMRAGLVYSSRGRSIPKENL